MISDIICEIERMPNCKVLSPVPIPDILLKNLPDDIKEFYSLCGGIVLFEDSSYSVRIVPPTEFSQANLAILGEEIINMEIENCTYDSEISKDWYIIADLFNSDYVVVDMNDERKGKCYKAFWDSYPDEGDTPIIALSFTELLQSFINSIGNYWFFLETDFKSYGDAYDTNK